ncbi:DUF3566 domain-containing protein [Blastococcus xanthinilyticus]|uniref:Transmembrane protein DUF3566 n=1 Tax=Blastococcus xanthinilyticus TaxID=1564164 RepID=A0A5S5CS79_9ACTN|nr:DUF3566 domain-containing protein [Blastococcus xanthinilyticus]TYP86465.1 transmembrane protein DUF3566 [Blastococcus xanthinilyticus]
MSDRTHGSVRTDSRAGDGAPGDGAGTGNGVSATQSIPTTGSQRAQGPASGAVPVVPQPLSDSGASPAGGAPAAQPAGGTAAGQAGAPETGESAPVVGPTNGPIGTGDGAAGPAAPKAGRGRQSGRGPRRARLQLRHIDTWSALKISLVLSIALFFIWMVAVGLLYMVLGGLGVFDAINDLVGQIGSASGSDEGGDVLTAGVVFGGAAVIGAINVVLLTALCTVGTFIYNLCSDLVGGLEVTLSERD